MSIEELFSQISKDLEGKKGAEWADRTFKKLRNEISKHKTFNPEKFYGWFVSKSVASKSVPLMFLEKCGLEDIEKSCFDDDQRFVKANHSIASEFLFEAMRLNGIKIIPNDTIYIDHVEGYILRNGLLTIDELIAWNHQAVEFLANKEKTTQDFIYLFKNTKLMRGLQLPTDTLEQEVEKEVKEWNEIMEKFQRARQKNATAIAKESETNNEGQPKIDW